MVTFSSDCRATPRPLGWDDLCRDAHHAAGDPSEALKLAPRLGSLLPHPGSGRTGELWECMAELGAIDLTVARTVEPHLDAFAILSQAPEPASEIVEGAAGAAWGVFAAEGPDARLEASGPDTDVRLTGRKPWCSLAGILDRALVTAWTSNGSRRLFAVNLHGDGVRVVDAPWVSRGLASVVSTPVDFDGAPAIVVGPEDWYLRRPGFAWGGLGVAAVWWGGAAGVVRTMLESAKQRKPDDVARMLLGQADAALHAAASVLHNAAYAIDAGGLRDKHAWPATLRIRHIVHDACEVVLRSAAHGLGPGPLTHNEEHARRVSDLELYLRQHKAERDAVAIGDGVLTGMGATWS